MKTLLQINSSLFAGDGQSSQLASQFVGQWQAANPQGQVIVRDLSKKPIPHLTAERFQAFQVAARDRTDEQARLVAESDELIQELIQADLIVLGLPMYNFGIPSTLKAWIDHVTRAGITFKYTEKGPVGLLKDKPVYLLAARGGNYLNTPKDTQTTYIQHLFNFIGIQNIEFVYAEGLAMGAKPRAESLSNASEQIARMAA